MGAHTVQCLTRLHCLYVMSSTLLQQHILKNIRNDLPDLSARVFISISTAQHSSLTYPESLRDLYSTPKTVLGTLFQSTIRT